LITDFRRTFIKQFFRLLWNGFWFIVDALVIVCSAILIFLRDACFDDYMNLFGSFGIPLLDYLLEKIKERQ